MQYKSIVLVDGENLVLRYQQMLKEGCQPKEGVLHIKDTFVWHPDLINIFGGRDLVRIGYYTTIVGDDSKLEKIKERISEAEYECELLNGKPWFGNLVPYVYKKSRKGTKTKSVDINLTIDALRYAYGDSIDQILLISGDGDYIPLLREVMARGKMVQALALSSGLNTQIKYNVDDFALLDDELFELEEQSEENDNA